MNIFKNHIIKFKNDFKNTYQVVFESQNPCKQSSLSLQEAIKLLDYIDLPNSQAYARPYQSFFELVEPSPPPSYHKYVGYGYDYADLFGRCQILDINYILIDNTEKNDCIARIDTKVEKKDPKFAIFFVKFKQLRLIVIQAVQHAKHNIVNGDKIDILSLLKNLCTSESYGYYEKEVTGRAKNSSMSGHFHFNRSERFVESKDSQRTALCKEKKISHKKLQSVYIVENALSPAF